MSVILQLASLRRISHIPLCSVRGHFRVRSWIVSPTAHRHYCIMPRTMDFEPRTRTSASKLTETDDYKLIYDMKSLTTFQINFMVALTFASVLAYMAFMEFNKEKETDSKPTARDSLESDSETPVPSERNELNSEKTEGSNNTFISTFLRGTPVVPYPILSYALIGCITFGLFYSHTRVVFRSYRYRDRYKTSFIRFLGFGARQVEHSADEISFYPNRKVFQFEIQGRIVVMFPEYFISEGEADLMMRMRK